MKSLSPKGKLKNWDNTNSLKRNDDKHRCDECGRQPRSMLDDEGGCTECQGLIGDNGSGKLNERNPIRRNYRDEDELEGEHPAAEDDEDAINGVHIEEIGA